MAMKRPNASKQSTPAAAKQRYVSIKIADGVRTKLRTVCGWKGLDMSAYLTSIVEPILDRELAQLARQLGSAKTRKPQ
jgi:hypothetical protein